MLSSAVGIIGFVKLALCFAPEAQGSELAVRRMLDAQTLRHDDTPAIVSVAGGAIGVLQGPEKRSTIALQRRSQSGNLLAVSGVPVDLAGSLDVRLAAVVEADHMVAARELAGLDGAFAAIFWSERARKLVVVTDFLGMQPLYELAVGHGLVMATEVKAVATQVPGAPIDGEGWGTFLALGYVWEDLTFVQGIRRAPPASIIVYDADRGTSERFVSWRWPAPRPDLGLADVDTGSLVEVLERSITAYGAYTPKPGAMLMSGGLDSRILLCALVRSRRSPSALVLAFAKHHDDAEGRFAMRASRALGVEPVFIPPAIDFYSSAEYLEYLLASEITQPSLGLFIAQLSAHVRPELEAVWEGVAPGTSLKLPHQPPGGFDAMLGKEASLPGSNRWKAAARVFAPAVFRSLEEGVHAALARVRDAYPDDSFGVAEFVARNRMRNRTGPNPLKVYANDVLPFTPGLARAFWDVTAAVPYEVKDRYRLYLELFRRHYPEGLSAPFLSGFSVVKRPGFDPIYLTTVVRGRIMKLPYLGGVIRRLGLRPRLVRDHSMILGRVLARVALDHPDLDADSVRGVLSGERRGDPGDRTARELLFYWQMWRWMMEGSFRRHQPELLGEVR